MAQEVDIAAIRKLRTDYLEAQEAGDVESALSFWAEDGVLMPPDSSAICGVDNLRVMYQELFATYHLETKVTFDQIDAAGDLGFIRCSYEQTATPKGGGAASGDSGKWLDIVRRQPDGTWRFANHIWNSDSAPDTEPGMS